MAEAEKNEKVQAEEPPARKKIPLNMIVAGIVVVCLIGGIFLVWKSNMLSGFFDRDGGDYMKEVSGRMDIGPTYSMDTFIVNLLGDRGKNYLKVQMELELDNLRVAGEIDRRLPQFRDAVLILLSNKTHEDIQTLEGKLQLRAEIISTLNQHLATGRILNVYFTDFIVQ